jgi:hypothetical protein
MGEVRPLLYFILGLNPTVGQSPLPEQGIGGRSLTNNWRITMSSKSLEYKRAVINMIANYFASTKGHNHFPSDTPPATIEAYYKEWKDYWTRSSRRSSTQLIRYIPELAREVRSHNAGYKDTDLRVGSTAYTPPQHNSTRSLNPTVGRYASPSDQLTAYFSRVVK